MLDDYMLVLITQNSSVVKKKNRVIGKLPSTLAQLAPHLASHFLLVKSWWPVP